MNSTSIVLAIICLMSGIHPTPLFPRKVFKPADDFQCFFKNGTIVVAFHFESSEVSLSAFNEHFQDFIAKFFQERKIEVFLF